VSSSNHGPAFRGDIAIVGLACTYPGARHAQQFWQNIINKVDAITDVSPERWNPDIFYDPDPNNEDRLYSKKGGWIPDTFSFNPFKFGIPPSSIAGSEPDHTLLIRCVFEALEDAGYLNKDFNRDRTSVTVGKGNYVGPGLMWMTLRTVVVEMMIPVARALRPDLTEEQIERLKKFLRSKLPTLAPDAANGLVPNIASARISNRFDFMGRNITVDAACGSMLIATEIAVRNLLMGLDDMALIGSVHCYNNIPFLQVFKVMRAISLTSTIRPFDANADGTMAGEGVSMMVLKRLADAERDGDRIYAVIKGVGSSSDGKAKAVMAPRVEGEALAVQRCYEMAQLPSDSIELIECHGTGTVVGDGVEIEALRRTYGPSPDGRPTVAIGSVKSMIGHAMPAAGGASLIKTALSLYHRILPPTLNVTEPHPLLRDPDCRFYVNSESRPWIHRPGGEPRRAAISAFGFGGINAHLVLEEYNKTPEAKLPTFLREWDDEVLVVEAASRAELVAALDRLRAYVIQVDGVALRDVAFTLNTSLKGAAHRVAIVASTMEEVAQKIDRLKQRLADPECRQIRERAGLYYFDSAELQNGKMAVLFPGEGSQYLNMLGELCMHFPEVRKAFDTAEGAVKDPKYLPLSSIVFPPPAFSEEEEAAAEARLWSIERATESVLTADGAMYTLLHELGFRPHMMAGHSAGEWIAMAASGMLELSEFVASMDRLSAMYTDLAARTEVPRMAMLAVGTGRERILEFAAEIGCEVYIANDNCPHQVVAVVEPAKVDALSEHLLKNGVFVEKLPYDRGYHTPSFTYICDPLRQFFQNLSLREPQLPVYSCITTEPYPVEREEILDLVSNTFAQPLLFRQTIEKMYEAGVRIFVESGPRGNLTAFVDDVLRGRPHLAIPTDLLRRPGLTVLNHALGMMAAAHVPLDFEPYYRRRSPRKLALDIKADSVLPEEKQPGVIQISTCYTKLAIPGASEFPMPGPEVVRVVEQVPVPVYQPSVSNGHSAPIEELPEYLTAATQPAATPTMPIGPLSASAFAEHFALMEEFLRTEEDIMTRLGQSVGSASALQAGVLVEHPQPQARIGGTVDSPAHPQFGIAVTPAVTPPPPAVVPTAAPVARVAPEAPAAPAVDLPSLLLKVVSERTGYPQDMLGLDQDMEADLGIDSIKRVEIFGALRDLAGEGALSGDGDMEAVAKLKTLREVLAFLEQRMPGAPPLPAAPVLGSLIRSATVANQVPGESVTLKLALDLDEHLYLRDHSLYYPSSERDNQINRVFVMPLTGSLELLCQAAAVLVPELKVTGAANMQVFRPLNVTENEGPTPIQITATRHGAGEIRVAIREDKPNGGVLSQSTVLVGPRYPDAPAPMEIALVNPRVPICTNRDVYETHRMFHGPSFQGICAINSAAENGLTAKLEIMPTENLLRSERRPTFLIDPYLLDAAGQLVGYWPLEFLEQGFVVLPVKISAITKYCENPSPGTILDYRLHLRNVSQRTLAADYDVILPDGRLWLRVTGWEDWRFYWPPTIYNCWRWAKTEYPSAGITIPALEKQGYVVRLIQSRGEQERDGLAGEVWMRILLNRREMSEFERVRTEQRPDWLLLRTTAKDAVRAWTTQHHGRQLYPADIELASRGDGSFNSGGFWTSEVPAPKVTAALDGPGAVAVAGPGECAVAALEIRNDVSSEALLPEEEEQLSRTSDPAEWRARFVAAKQAVARYLRPSEYSEYWKSLVVAKLDRNQGMMEIADPGSAVNAEDTVSVATGREGELIVAVAFK
jgi:acyl transferase domain-containing protein